MSMERDQIQAYARELAAELGETDEGPLRQIELLLEHAGEEFVKSALEETLKLEAGEGLKTEDGQRRRTKGGVFFYITKGKLSPEIRQIVFPNFGQGQKNKGIEWEERSAHLEELLAQTAGETASLTVTVHGRPDAVVKHHNSVVLSLTNKPSNMNLAKGIPQPPDEATTYTVYMGLRQWEAVEEALHRAKGDKLIVEGGCHLDKDSGTIAIFARSVTTRNLAKNARREAQPKPEAAPNAKPAKQPKQGKKPAAAAPQQPVAPQPEVDESAPMGIREKLAQLQSAAETLRERVQTMESKGQPGVAMTRKLLQNTEQQIEALERQIKK